MALLYIASLSISALCPSVQLAMGSVAVGLNGSLQGNLALNASLTVSPPTLSTQLTASADFSAALLVAETSIPPPLSFSFSLSETVSLQASLNASLSIYLPSLLSLLALNAGIYAFGWAGTGDALGGAVTTELATSWPDGAPTTGTCTALIFGAATNLALTPPDVASVQMASFLGGVPFSGGLAYGGKLGLPALSPVTNGATVQASAGISAQLAASAHLAAAVPITLPSFAAMISAQAKFFANLQASAKVPLPTAALSATASASASLSANFGAMCTLGGALEREDAVLFVYSYTGAANALGAALTSALASVWGDGVTPTSGACTVSVLAATDGISIAALTGFFGGA